MRLLTKIAVAMVCLCFIPLYGVSFGQDVSTGEMAVKGEQIKPVPGVSVEMAMAQQKAKVELVAQKQALESGFKFRIPEPPPFGKPVGPIVIKIPLPRVIAMPQPDIGSRIKTFINRVVSIVLKYRR